MTPLKFLILVVLGASLTLAVDPVASEVSPFEVDPSEEVASSSLATSLDAPDMGNWTVPNCIVVKMAGKLTVLPLVDNSTYSIEVEVPTEAVASGNCDNPSNQTITLTWNEKEAGTKKTLERTLVLVFGRNDTASPPVYGVKKVEGTYQTQHFKKDNETYVTEFITFGTFTLHPLEFQTPINRSYLCMDVGTISMHAELHTSDEPQSAVGEKLNNVNFTARNVQLDAFRPVDLPVTLLQTPLDCSFRPSDVVPIVVGCALAGTVLLVLISYLVGRRRNRARGYQSV